MARFVSLLRITCLLVAAFAITPLAGIAATHIHGSAASPPQNADSGQTDRTHSAATATASESAPSPATLVGTEVASSGTAGNSARRGTTAYPDRTRTTESAAMLGVATLLLLAAALARRLRHTN